MTDRSRAPAGPSDSERAAPVVVPRTTRDGAAEAQAGSVKSAERVLDIVDLLTRHPPGLTFVEIREELDLPKSSLSALLRTMRVRGHLAFDERRHRFRLGIRFWEAGQAFLAGTDLRNTAQPHLQRAADRLGETVQLAILDGLDNVYIAKVEGKHLLRLVSEVGSRLPAHATGLGKVLLSGLEEGELRRRLKGRRLERFTETTIADPAALLVELEKIRRRGYAIDDGEMTVGVYCVAVPVRNHLGETVAALSSSVPDARLSPEKVDEMIAVLTKQADAISRALGSVPRD